MKFRSAIAGSLITLITLIAGCGGGGTSKDNGGGLTLAASNETTQFQTSDFASKSVYLVDENGLPTYELAVFNSDGTGLTSYPAQAGSPVAQQPFTWSIDTDGRLRIVDDGEVILVSLVSQDKANRYYSIKAELNGLVALGGIYYDQSTGLAQAKQYVIDRGGPTANWGSPTGDNSGGTGGAPSTPTSINSAPTPGSGVPDGAASMPS